MATKRNVTLTVEVTAQDIAEGREGDCWHCPIALALTRAVGGEPVHVNFSDISDGGGGWYRKLPTEAVSFQRWFDRGDPVEPFSFKVRVPGHYVSSTAAPA